VHHPNPTHSFSSYSSKFRPKCSKIFQREKELKLWYKKRAKELNLNPDFFASLFLEVIEEWKKML